MANCYITLGGLKLDVLYGGIGGDWEAEDDIQMTLNNKVYRSIGTRSEKWKYGVKVKYVPDSGYAGYSNLRTWRFDQTVAGNSLALIDEFGTNQGNVTIEDMTKPVPKGKTLDGPRAIYTSVITLRKLQ